MTGDLSARAAPLERRIEATLAALLPDYPRVALCAAFSGGLDSTVLLTALARALPRRRSGPRLRAVHVDHGLHADSAVWARHCLDVASRLRVPLIVTRIEVARARGLSLEASARDARYGALAATLDEGEVLLTAQHADDQLETVLLQLLRGAGMRGLAAMPAVTRFGPGRLARPLLDVERSELEAWARARKLEWIEDSTNADEHLDRNYLRRRIVPVLRARWPAVSRAVSRSARNAAEAQRLLDLLGQADAGRAAVGEALSIKRLRALPPDRRRNALRLWIVRRGGPLPDARRLQELSGPLIEARADAHPEVAWGGMIARREGDRLSLEAREPRRIVTDVSVLKNLRSMSLEWLAPAAAAREARAQLELPAGLGRLELTPDPHGPIDLDALPERIIVRLRRGGERLRLRHGGPSRSLKALLQESRIPLSDRACLPLLWSAERLLAAADLWVDAGIRAGASARRRARLSWRRARAPSESPSSARPGPAVE